MTDVMGMIQNAQDTPKEASVKETSVSLPMGKFYKAIRSLKRILPSRKSDMPVEAKECVQISVGEMGEGKAKVWGRSDSHQFEFSFNEETDSIASGHISIPVRPIIKPIRKIKKKSDRLIISAEKDVAKFDAGIASFEVDLKYHDDSPPSSLNYIEDQMSTKEAVESKKFRKSVSYTSFAANPEAEKRSYLRGLVFRPCEGSLHILASDGSIVADADTGLDTDWVGSEFVVSAESMDPVLKVLDSDTIELCKSNVLQIDQGHKRLKTVLIDEDYPSIEDGFSRWESEADVEVTTDASKMKEGVEFMDVLPYGDDLIRIMAGGCPLTLRSGRTSEKKTSFQVDDGQDNLKFPTCQIKRSYLKSILKEVDGELRLASASDEDIPLIVEKEGEVIYFVMKYT